MRKKKIIYLIGSMEGRTYRAVSSQHKRIRTSLEGLGYYVIDPLLKEKHDPKSNISLHNCGIPKRKVFNMDLEHVENSNILYWCTGDIMSEGSEVEFAYGGGFNRLLKKGYIKESCPFKKKMLIIVGKKRYLQKIDHFQNMWQGVKVFGTDKQALGYLRGGK